LIGRVFKGFTDALKPLLQRMIRLIDFIRAIPKETLRMIIKWINLSAVIATVVGGVAMLGSLLTFIPPLITPALVIFTGIAVALQKVNGLLKPITDYIKELYYGSKSLSDTIANISFENVVNGLGTFLSYSEQVYRYWESFYISAKMWITDLMYYVTDLVKKMSFLMGGGSGESQLTTVFRAWTSFWQGLMKMALVMFQAGGEILGIQIKNAFLGSMGESPEVMQKKVDTILYGGVTTNKRLIRGNAQNGITEEEKAKGYQEVTTYNTPSYLRNSPFDFEQETTDIWDLQAKTTKGVFDKIKDIKLLGDHYNTLAGTEKTKQTTALRFDEKFNTLRKSMKSDLATKIEGRNERPCWSIY